MAAQAPARAVEKPPGQMAEASAAAPNPEAGAGRDPGEDGRWRPVLGLPCEFIVELPVPGFKISDLLKLRRGSIVNAHWRVGQDAPLLLNGTLVGWTEFEVMGTHLAVRLTELV